MKNNLTVSTGWIVATFTLATLLLWSVTYPSNSEPNTVSTEKEESASNVSIEPLIGEIIMFAGNFAPRNWALCDGQLLPINSHQALFSILGTTYGGDGRTTFGLPDLRGRVPVHAGQGAGLSSYRLGQKGGTEKVSISKGTPVAPTKKAGSVNVVTANTQPSNLQPYTTVNYIIALEGIFPSRN